MDDNDEFFKLKIEVMEMAIINSIDKSQSWNILAQKWNQLDLIVFIMLWTVLFNCFCWKKM